MDATERRRSEASAKGLPISLAEEEADRKGLEMFLACDYEVRGSMRLSLRDPAAGPRKAIFWEIAGRVSQ